MVEKVEHFRFKGENFKQIGQEVPGKYLLMDFIFTNRFGTKKKFELTNFIRQLHFYQVVDLDSPLFLSFSSIKNILVWGE